MTDITIPDAAMEAAARAAYEEGFLRHVRRTRFGFTWDEISDEARESWRQVVIAAAPHIAAQALMDAADEVRGYAYTPDDVREVAHGDDYADGITDAHHVFDRLLAARADRIEADHG